MITEGGLTRSDVRGGSVELAGLASGSITEKATDPAAFRVVVATGRPTIRAFFEAAGRQSGSAILVTCMPLSSGAAEVEAIGSAHIAVVDASVDRTDAIDFCVQALTVKPELKIVALLCCPYSATAGHVRALASVGVRSFVEEAQLSEEEILWIAQDVARGQAVLRLKVIEKAQTLFTGSDDEALPSKLSGNDQQLLEQIVLGRTDTEIAHEMYLSRHTVKHRIERLRRHAGVKNRVQLAVWAVRLSVLSDTTLFPR